MSNARVDYCSFLPDRPGGFDFRSACVAHDTCYGTWAAFSSKEDCDDRFEADLTALCAGDDDCLRTRNTYVRFFLRSPVVVVGAYRRAQCDGAERAGVVVPEECDDFRFRQGLP